MYVVFKYDAGGNACTYGNLLLLHSLFVGSDSEALPDGSILEVAGAIELSQFVLRNAPTKSVISKAGKATIGNTKSQSDVDCQAHVRDGVEDEKTLSKHREGTRACVSPHDTGSVESSEHEEVAETTLSEDIPPSGVVDLDGEGRAIVGAIDVRSSDASE